jgi:hypothetical protein
VLTPPSACARVACCSITANADTFGKLLRYSLLLFGGALGSFLAVSRTSLGGACASEHSKATRRAARAPGWRLLRLPTPVFDNRV